MLQCLFLSDAGLASERGFDWKDFQKTQICKTLKIIKITIAHRNEITFQMFTPGWALAVLKVVT